MYQSSISVSLSGYQCRTFWSEFSRADLVVLTNYQMFYGIIKTYQCPLAGRQVGYIYQRYQDVSGSYQCRGLSAAYRIL